MSTTNKAFIKAYRHDDPQRPLTQPPAPTVMSERAARAQATAAANAAGPSTSNSIFGNQPAAGSMPDARAPYASTTTPNMRRVSTPGPVREKRPLSSFIEPPPSMLESPSPESIPELRIDDTDEDSGFRPGTTIASFQWPAVCRTLLQKTGPQLDQVTRLLWTRAAEGKSLIGVFTLFAGGGATTTAQCLALRAAARGGRILVGDANFRTPHLAQSLEAVPTAGWEEVLKNSSPLADAVIHSTDDNIDVLALGPRPAKDPHALASGLQATATAGMLRHAYELALLDLGTFFDPASQSVLLELVRNMGLDAAVAVAGHGPADPRDIVTINEYFAHTECEFLGIIENRVAKPYAA